MMMFYMSSQAEREDWFEQGMDIGEERGRDITTHNTVLRMIRKGYDVREVADVVGIRVEEVEEIVRKNGLVIS
ncbi:MAG: hypothetical protein IKL88_07240 [Erysipelotrichales bacterium]|nr:hypothetical protein [Erysipelotrichales bacterium]